MIYLYRDNGVITVGEDGKVPVTYYGRGGKSGKFYPSGSDNILLTIGGDSYDIYWENLTIEDNVPLYRDGAVLLLEQFFSGLPVHLPLNLVWSNISYAPVGNPSSVSDWNTYFDLPAYGNPFTSVEVIGNEVNLYGGSDIILQYNLFSGNSSLITANDLAGCVISTNDSCFYSCTSLTSVSFPLLTNAGVFSFCACTLLTSISLPSLTIAQESCFNGCSSLTSIYLPSLTIAGQQCFTFCTSLTSVDLPLVTETGESCFNACPVLTSVNLPSLTTAIYGSFSNCTSLSSISLPSLTTAGTVCFVNCYALSSIYLPSLITAGDASFANCYALESVDFPLVATIGESFFANDGALTSINIPSCTNLGGGVGDNDVFLDINGNTITLTVPVALMTCDSGSPDGDIQYLQFNNTVNIITV